MKILYVCTSTETGGAETALRALVFAARGAGHRVKVLSLKSAGGVGAQIKAGGVDVQSLDLRGKLRPLEAAGALARLAGEIQAFKPDVVHACLYRAIQFCRLAKRRIPFKLVTTPHYDLSRKKAPLRLLDRALKDLDDVSCAESRSTAEFLLKKQKYKKEKVRLVPNGADVNFFCPDETARQKARAEMGFNPQETVFVCTARLSPEKNHRLLIASFAAVHRHNAQTKLILLGDGPEKDALAALAAQKGLSDAVRFMGEVSDVRNFLLASDVFVLVSSIESLPMALLEACSCGLPAVVSKSGDMPFVAEHGKNGFVCDGKDPVLLSVLLDELAANRPLRRKMGRCSRQKIEKNYPPPEDVYLKIYKEIQ